MPRQARVVIPGIAHHITQRGNRRQPVFFFDDDYRYYLDLLGTWSKTCHLAILAYCLMPNHIHLIVKPSEALGMAKSMNEIHRRYTRYINFREKWTGHLWQGRYSSFALSARHLYHALRYVEDNPVRASLTDAPESWRWSSAYERINSTMRNILASNDIFKIDTSDGHHSGTEFVDSFRNHIQTGLPLGDGTFIEQLEMLAHRPLRHGKPGPKPKPEE